ncbi:MAG: threonine synthase, partial [Gammaproteobacteria bacterium]|nr:threonine synthase [Gammaproteobacteria bacterium]
MLTGLAPDGGLLVPETIPDVTSRLASMRGLSFVELAREIVPLFVDDIPREDLDRLITDAYANFDHSEISPLTRVGNLTVMELFHGPTLAFKDVALQLLGRIFEYILGRENKHLNILVATSGDTGSAAIAGVRGFPEIDIFVMYPRGRVSHLQELQMTTVIDTNVHCLAVEGSFDDCQNLMKTIFGDLAFKEKYALGAANSVNWARVLAQIVYYAYASLKLGGERPVSFCVPTGNFGNVFAGYTAKRMGFPITRLL